jgi:hypothetical protein
VEYQEGFIALAGMATTSKPKRQIRTLPTAAAEVIKERGLDIDKNYTGHRGLL